MAQTASSEVSTERVSLDKFEKFHRRNSRPPVAPATMREIGLTLGVSLAVTPFFLTTFFVLPMIGQVVVGCSLGMSLLYLWVRRSILVALATIIGSGSFAIFTYLTIQGLKDRLDVALFIFLVLGVPVASFFCMFMGMRIWALVGGEE